MLFVCKSFERSRIELNVCMALMMKQSLSSNITIKSMKNLLKTSSELLYNRSVASSRGGIRILIHRNAEKERDGYYSNCSL